MMSLPSFVRADEYTGLPVDDPKDLVPTPPCHATTSSASQSITDSMFVAMPTWARGVIMPPLPDQLKPMGKRSMAASGPVAPVVPPKDASPASTTNGTETATASGKPENNPAMITVSPFLQWIKANPQAAAAQARQQANVYHAGPAAPPAPSTSADDAYWLPPMMDSTTTTTGPVGGSAAIYSTPQR